MSLAVGAENGPGPAHICGNGCPTTDTSTVPNALNDSGVLSTPEPNGMVLNGLDDWGLGLYEVIYNVHCTMYIVHYTLYILEL